MCGIAGAVLPRSRAETLDVVTRMCDAMIARGPDDSGVLACGEDPGAPVLGNRRLSVIDLSEAGHQPMVDESGRVALVFNGMIYNFRELRHELEAAGHRFRSTSDTEVVLHAYMRFGKEFVERLRGMFGLAVWDGRSRELLLARDRLGIKPLYYVDRTDGFAFASQVRALLAGGVATPSLDPAAIRSYLTAGAVIEPATAIKGVLALPAGHLGVLRDGRLTVSRFWEPPRASERALPGRDAADELRSLLDDVVRRHLQSDAPIGVFLSGGLDSSVLTALAARFVPGVRAVSVVFDERELSEEIFMDSVARHLGVDHVVVRMRSDELRSALPDAVRAMDQPTFDGLNTFAVSRAAAAGGLKVALSGLGADELFDGYGHVRRVQMLEWSRRLPRSVRALVPAALVAGTGSAEKTAYWLRGSAPAGASYELLRRLFLAPDVDSIAGRNGQTHLSAPLLDLSNELSSEVAAADLAHYTRNVLLRDTDALSMASSLEVRVPYLDDVLVEWSLSLPRTSKGARKQLLAKTVGSSLPPEIVTRKKQGFVLPLETWMRGPLQRAVEETLEEPPGALADLLDGGAVRRVWQEFRDGRRPWLQPWSLFVLSKWVETLESA